MANKIGILGGTFDPIHYGHLAIAQAADTFAHFDRVLIIPTGFQPLKNGQHHASAQQRLHMAQLACAEYSKFEVSAIEVARNGPSYTLTTLEELSTQLISTFYLIVGADALQEFDHWHAPYRVLELAHIIGVERPGTQTQLDAVYAKLPTLQKRLTLLEGPHLAISSSNIRQRIARGESIHGLTPERVVDYIEQQKLYRQ
jgi:nicotinate-nucleotide adenylyltransferase